MGIFVDENFLQRIHEQERVITNVFDIFNLQGLYIKKIVKFCKNIGPFKELKQQDQLAILKPFHSEIMSIRNSYLYCPERQGYYTIVVSEILIFLKYDLKTYCYSNLVRTNPKTRWHL